jgi:hypothetical protein
MAMGVTGYADLAPVPDEADMHGVKGFGITDFFEQIVSFFGRYFFANESQPLGDAMDVSVYGKGGTAE